MNIKTPVFEETADDVTEMVHLANSLGVSIEIGSNITPKKDGDLSPTKMEISSPEKEYHLMEMISQLIPSQESAKDNFIKAENLRICGAGDKSISIAPYGEVFPCNMLQLCIGDLTKQSINEIWEESVQLKWWRTSNLRNNRKGCENCKYSDECAFCPGEAMMRTGNPLTKYEKACRDTYALVGREKRKEEINSEKI